VALNGRNRLTWRRLSGPARRADGFRRHGRHRLTPRCARLRSGEGRWLAGVRRSKHPAPAVPGGRDGRRAADTSLGAQSCRQRGRAPRGLQLLPDALPDDGLPHVAVLAPHGALEWLRVVGRVVSRRPRRDRLYRTRQGHRVTVAARRQHPREADGEELRPGRSMAATIEPAAITVRVPVVAS
jgi:diacylglycerol kinase family enzyme